VITLKRDRILQEAARLFFERGYLQTSVEAIAERLGATKPFVYYHFQSKAEILVEICEQSNRDVLLAAESAMSAPGSPRDRFEQFLSDFTNVALLQHQHVAIYFREEISLPAQAAERIRQMRKSINMRLTALLNEGVASGEFQIEDTRICALVIAGMSSYAFAWYREDGRLDQQEVTQRIVKMALNLVGVQSKLPGLAR
jgi:AcrR family transcriptional regulator